MIELRYETASVADIDTIFIMAKELIDCYEDVDSIDYDKVIAWVKRKISSNISNYTRVCADKETVAYFHLILDGKEAELDDLYVLPKFRNRGIGTQILEKCINTTVKSIYLYVFNKNIGAISLYERMGFIKREEIGSTRLIMARKG